MPAWPHGDGSGCQDGLIGMVWNTCMASWHLVGSAGMATWGFQNLQYQLILPPLSSLLKLDLGNTRTGFFPPQLRDSNFGCVWGLGSPSVGLELSANPPAPPPWTVCVPHRDTVCVPHRHCVCSTQTMSLFHRDRTPVDPECTGYAE